MRPTNTIRMTRIALTHLLLALFASQVQAGSGTADYATPMDPSLYPDHNETIFEDSRRDTRSQVALAVVTDPWSLPGNNFETVAPGCMIIGLVSNAGPDPSPPLDYTVKLVWNESWNQGELLLSEGEVPPIAPGEMAYFTTQFLYHHLWEQINAFVGFSDYVVQLEGTAPVTLPVVLDGSFECPSTEDLPQSTRTPR